MTDVDMPDAPATAPVTKKKGGAAGDAEGKEGKKRFEVKKVSAVLIRPSKVEPALTIPPSGMPLLSGLGT